MRPDLERVESNWMHLLLLTLLLPAQIQAQEAFYRQSDRRCYLDSVTPLGSYANFAQRTCAVYCYQTSRCWIFSFIAATGTCKLYSAVTKPVYQALTINSLQCETWARPWSSPGAAFYLSSGSFKVPFGITELKVIAVGGGAGGSIPNGGGGGSGYVSFSTIHVTSDQTFTVTVGSGGSINSLGGTSVFGNNLVVASGGQIYTNDYRGGPGGSGGGTGWSTNSGASGSGGSSGNAGTMGSSGFSAGSGQGSSFTSYFSQFSFSTLTVGSGAAGFVSTANAYGGGGGAGGVLINGSGPSSSVGSCYISAVWYGPGVASGYGAGGSGGCCYSGTCYNGGSGASGFVYIEYK